MSIYIAFVRIKIESPFSEKQITYCPEPSGPGQECGGKVTNFEE